MADGRSASVLEVKPIDIPQGHYDVAILGGGLAGLTMALQLERERPETGVLVADRRAEAAFKVGESTVEIAARYYRNMVGMRDHLEQHQIRKLGLRFFLPAGENSDITKRVEFCTPDHLHAFTHQIDGAGSKTSCSGAHARPAPTHSAAGASPTSTSGPTRARSR